jgi:uncharacterized protein (DUF362 family)/NAD-dependent dihydropyrimidine dehydrogenase PreA subunit
MPARVYIGRCSRYDIAEISTCIKQGIEKLGLSDTLATSKHILLKPNLLLQSHVAKGVCTAPEVIAGIVENLPSSAESIKVGDSPGFGKATAVMKGLHYPDVLNPYPVQLVDFDTPVDISYPEGNVFRQFTVDRHIHWADTLINVARIKTHGHMGLTLAVKNTFGFVVGIRKAQWHMRSGVDPLPFAKMLVELHYASKPTLNIVEGISAMQGDGPQHGDPYPLQLIVMGTDGIAVDRVICELVGFNAVDIPIFQAAQLLGHGVPDLNQIEICGETLEAVQVSDFTKPKRLNPDNFILPAQLSKYLKKSTTISPKVNKQRCIQCKVCVNGCPPHAMELNEKGGGVRVNYHTCIRCYCCHELCPEDAVELKKGWVLRLIHPFVKGMS